jgi:hypothetical protein
LNIEAGFYLSNKNSKEHDDLALIVWCNTGNQAVTLTNVPTVCPLVLTVGFGADACAALAASSESLSLLVLLGA